MAHNQNQNPAKRAKIESEFQNRTADVRVDAMDHIICNPGQVIGSYKVEKTLGEGSFGRVLLATDVKSGKRAALKIMKNDETKRKVAMMEIAALTTISDLDPEDESLCIKMQDHFMSELYFCIVFPMLGLSVFDFIKMNNFEPFPIDQVQHISHQLCTAVNFLHRNGMIHTDLKPENILFVNSEFTITYDEEKNCDVKRINNTQIRLIDFGLLTRDNEAHGKVISTRYYRAPEVILELGWSQPCDVWSIGCVLVEIYFGSPLFDTHDDREHLAIMEKTLGPIPSAMANATETAYFSNGILDWIWEGWQGIENSLSEYFMPLQKYKSCDDDIDTKLFDLIEKMLEYEPTKRIQVDQALVDSFFKVTANKRHEVA